MAASRATFITRHAYGEAMRWDKLLPDSIVLRDGRAIRTLADAARLLAEVPRHLRQLAHWQLAAELILEAADHNGDLSEAWAQLMRALRADRLI